MTLVVPAGLDRFFEEAGVPGTDVSSVPPPPGSEEIEKLLATAERYGIEFPPPPEVSAGSLRGNPGINSCYRATISSRADPSALDDPGAGAAAPLQSPRHTPFGEVLDVLTGRSYSRTASPIRNRPSPNHPPRRLFSLMPRVAMLRRCWPFLTRRPASCSISVTSHTSP